MAWYRAGTISVTSGSNIVTGAGTAFVANVQPGDAILLPNGGRWEILSINSDTQLTLFSNYTGAAASGQPYDILPTRGYIRDLAINSAALLLSFADLRDGIGIGAFPDGTLALPGFRFAADTNTGIFRPANDSIALVTQGGARVTVSGSGTFLDNRLVATANLVVRGGVAAGEGGQLVLGYGSGAATDITGQGNSTWNIDVDSVNALRVFRVNASGVSLTAMTVAESDRKVTFGGDVQVVGNFNVTNNLLIQHSTHGYVRTQAGGGNLYLGANGANVVTINSAGNVGIGASTINDRLTVDGNVRVGAGGDIRISSASAPTDGTKDTVLFNDAAELRIQTNGATLTTLTSAGVLVLGHSNPGAVVGSGFLRVRADPAQNHYAICATTENAGGMVPLQFVVNGGQTGVIQCTGSGTSYVTTSDLRLKMNIADADEDAGALIDAISIKKFDWRINGEHQRFGGIAQDIFEIFPEAVSPPMEGDENGTWGVDWSKFVPLMLKEIQNLRERVSALEAP